MDHNINVYMRGGNGGRRKGTSAKYSIARNKGNKQAFRQLTTTSKRVGSGISAMNSGNSPVSLAKSLGKGAAVASAMLLVADKIVSFGINYKQAKTGNQLTAHNEKTSLNTVMSFGTNYLFGGIQNELFNKQVVTRQNLGLDYGREIYNMNIEGIKNKRI